ncbi:uncharacterized protein HD556DRAFT_1446769 [Suillus plorans]|uniref:Uncharacterized protein n=1 Tax=Suillus plorans TaxID=116603 RepID=A0A9P7DEM6_9AGAM|nr:uncharacterized protein HD556DRAFT_1446769 [Suillus plorans]KAG1789755.1 hypothetical protein HD556DRAFT_1446769 [Suillus plorans]
MQDKLGQAAWRRYHNLGRGLRDVIFSDFPHNTRWFTPEERAFVLSPLVEDGYGKADELGKQPIVKELRDAVSDWKMWWFSATAMFQAIE